MRDWHLVGIGFGSNLGDREINIKTAVSMLMEEGILCKCLSGVYKTKPVGFSSTNDFANAVGIFETGLNALEVLELLMLTERKMGRLRGDANGYSDRIIDLDLLFYRNEVIELPELRLPHPRMHEREFVMRPLAEVHGEWIHPVLEQSASEIWESLKMKG
jgi:2-amino-4-hydroxy-6-hydroxymethyldihydropteridine diphosphokinase